MNVTGADCKPDRAAGTQTTVERVRAVTRAEASRQGYLDKQEAASCLPKYSADRAAGDAGAYCTRRQVWDLQISPPATQPASFIVAPLTLALPL